MKLCFAELGVLGCGCICDTGWWPLAVVRGELGGAFPAATELGQLEI